MRTPHLPTVGIVGAGQLARMTAQAAISLGVRIELLADRADDGAALVSPNVTIGSPNDYAALRALAERCDVITFDHELVPAEHLERLEREGFALYPSAATMALSQNKRLQRERFAVAGLPVPAFRTEAGLSEVGEFANEHGWPVVLKSARGGYDGRGVWIVESPDDAGRLVRELSSQGVELIVEELVRVDLEIAILVARNPSGQVAVYSAVETVQVDGMCREIVAPAQVSDAIAADAHEIAARIAELSGVVGVLAVELFVSDGRVLINEIATRPHNSGHYTIEGSVTSQFEQHLRAMLDWPLGSTELTAPAVVTVNVVGGPDGADPATRVGEALAVERAHLHLYGKGARPGRKLGHVTVCGDDLESTRASAARAAGLLTGVELAGSRR
jgi:5-(carboxyamino)imidazole ribonucleotide synthase